MCVCDWELVVAAALIQLVTVVYGQISRRGRTPPGPSEALPAATARHRTGEPVRALRARHGATGQPHYPSPSRKTT